MTTVSLAPTSPATQVSDRARFEAVYAEEFVPLARYCWALVRDKELAEDIASEAFAVLLGRIVRVQDPKPYLYRVATNLVRAQWRRAARDRDRVERLVSSALSAPAADELTATVLRSAVLTLPRKHRDVVLLHYYAGLSVAEVGAAVGRPAGTVKRLLFEARARLAAEVEEP